MLLPTSFFVNLSSPVIAYCLTTCDQTFNSKSKMAAPPTIIVDKPGTSSNTVPTAVHSNLDRPLTPRISVATTPKTTSFPSNSVPSCYLCDEQNPGDFSPTTKFLETCLLCARPFCPVHKAVQYEKVCNIPHSKYYHEMLENMKDAIASKSPDGTARRMDAEDEIHEAGIFPSLGERDKVLFRTSPVSPGK